MTTIVAMESSLQKQVRVLQYVTLSWMLIECSIALYSAWKAGSVSLLAFGSDSFVELVSAGVVLLQFSLRRRISQARAARLCGSLLYALAGVVCLIAAAGLVLRQESDASRLGIAVTACALLLMPVLAGLKRRAADRLGNKALRADAVQSATCAYLAAITLAGLLLRLFLGLGWPDKVAALAAVPILIVEARRARRGVSCGCC